MREGLGYTRLLPFEQDAYKVFLAAFQNRLESFDLSGIDNKVDLMKVMHAVLGDNPSIMYFDKSCLRTVTSLFKRQLQLNGFAGKTQQNKIDNELMTKANIITSKILKSWHTDFDKIVAVYDYLQKNVKYDEHELKANMTSKSKNPFAHNAYGALINRLAVCDGFSAAFCLLVQKLGYNCTVINGKSTIHSSQFTEHAWNVIQVNKKCYHMDVTWDSNKFSKSHVLSYDYFGLSDDEIANSHDWDIMKTSPCTNDDLSYFVKTNSKFTNSKQLQNYIRNSLINNASVIQFKVSYNLFLGTSPREYINDILINTAQQLGKVFKYEYMWNEGTRNYLAKITY